MSIRTERTMYGLALTGLLVSTHLWFQQQTGFAGGCTGLGLEGPGWFDCAAVTSGPGSRFLGLSNTIWGVLFYWGVGALSTAALWTRGKAARWAYRSRLGLITVGAAYTGHLGYLQWTQLEAACLLCLISMGLVAGLLAAQISDIRRQVLQPGEARSPGLDSELRRWAGAAGLLLLLIAGDMVRVGGPGALRSSECAFASEQPLLQRSSAIVDEEDAIQGGGAVTRTVVIEFFDPSCPHCRDLYPVLKRIAEDYGESVRFVYKPIPIWKKSVPAVQALYAARERGRFFALLDQMMDREHGEGVRMPVAVWAAVQQAGLPVEAVMKEVGSGRYLQSVHRTVRQAERLGISSVPTVLIDGKVVETRSEACLRKLLRRKESLDSDE